eukprot:Sspe_Gene.82758::Locus_54247_Transcript_1_1_Confidence_1.000_Length_2329::g.82758::m.82758
MELLLHLPDGGSASFRVRPRSRVWDVIRFARKRVPCKLVELVYLVLGDEELKSHMLLSDAGVVSDSVVHVRVRCLSPEEEDKAVALLRLQRRHWHAVVRHFPAAVGSRRVVLEAVQLHDCVLQDVLPPLNSDKEIVAFALERDPLNLRYVGDEFREDRELVWKMVERDPHCYSGARGDVLKDRGMCLYAAKGGVDVFSVSKHFASDPEVAEVVCSWRPDRLTVSPLREDREFMEKMVRCNPMAYNASSRELRTDKAFAMLAISLAAPIRLQLLKELCVDGEFMISLLKTYPFYASAVLPCHRERWTKTPTSSTDGTRTDPPNLGCV